MKSSYRIGKPWRGSRKNRRDYITYLASAGKGDGQGVPDDGLLTVNYTIDYEIE